MDQHDHQVTFFGAIQGFADGVELKLLVGHRTFLCAQPHEFRAYQLGYLPFVASSRITRHFLDDDVVESNFPCGGGQLAYRVVTAIACLPDYQQALLRRVCPRQFKDSVKPVRVMCKIHQHGHAVDMKKIAAAGIRIGMCLFEARNDRVLTYPQCQHQPGSAQRIGDIVSCRASKGNRNIADIHQALTNVVPVIHD